MKATKLHIKTPCSEDFTKMISTETGAYCDKCSHEVYDFTNKSESEIETFLFENGDKRICGKIEKPRQNKSSFSLLKIAASLAFINFSDHIIAQESTETIDTNSVQQQQKTVDFNGIVRDQNGEAVPFVRILVSGKKMAYGETDLDGTYKIKIPYDLWLDNDSAQVTVKSPEYSTLEFSINRSLDTTMKKDISVQIINEIQVVPSFPHSIGIIYIPPVDVKDSNPNKTVITEPFKRLDERD